MRRLALQLAAIFVFASSALTLTAGPLSLIDDLLRLGGRSVDDVARGNIPGTGISVVDDAFRGLPRGQVEEIGSALAGMRRYSGEFVDADRAAVMRLLRGELDMGIDHGRTIPLSADAPFFRIRASQRSNLDRALNSFARARYDRTLSARFSMEDLRVVALGLSDDAAESSAEAARYSRTLGRHVYDRVGPLSRLHETVPQTDDGIRAALRPYRGRTVVMVGHVPSDLGAFFVYRNGERVSIPIDRWMSLAQDLDINLIPIGCNSYRLASLGAEGIVNTADVLSRLQSVLQQNPNTIGDFYRGFSSSDLVLVANPTNLSLRVNLAIVTRERNRMIGRALIETGKRTPSIIQGIEDLYFGNIVEYDMYTPPLRRHYTFCFQEAEKPSDFENCLIEIVAQDEQQREYQEAFDRENRRSGIEDELQLLKETEKRVTLALVLAIVTNAIMMLLSPLLFLFSLLSINWYEKEFGWSLRGAFAPANLRLTLDAIVYAFSNPESGWRVLALLAASVFASLVIGIAIPLVILELIPGDYEFAALFACVLVGALALKFSISALWEAIKEDSSASALTGLSFVPLSFSVFLVLQTYSALGDVSHRLQSTLDERERLVELRPSDLVILSDIKETADPTPAR